MNLSSWNWYTVGDIQDSLKFSHMSEVMNDDQYSYFVEFVELNSITEQEWPIYFECYCQMLKEM